MKSNRVKNWRLLIEDFGPTIEYYPGEQNVEADTMSRHPTKTEKTETSEVLEEVMLNYPKNVQQFPAQLHLIHQSQQANQHILDLTQLAGYEMRNYSRYNLVCRENKAGEWQIVIAGAMVNDILEWYHTLLSHPGVNRTERTIAKLFYIPNLRASVEAYIQRCDACQRRKATNQRVAQLAPREDNCYPFEEVAVDLIGPWRLEVDGIGLVEFNALTMIDTTTVLTELVCISN